MSTGNGEPGIDMPKKPRRSAVRQHSLGVAIAGALTVKVVTLALLYFAFFIPSPNLTPPSERTATAVFGLPAAKP